MSNLFPANAPTVSNSPASDPLTRVGSVPNLPRIDRPGREHLADDAESAAAEREERWRLAAEAAADGLWEWNPTTRELHWSPGVARMLGSQRLDREPAHRGVRIEQVAVLAVNVADRLDHLVVGEVRAGEVAT